jgi:hypothetical protein
LKILELLEGDSQKTFVSMLAMEAAGHAMPKAEEEAIAAAARQYSVSRDLGLVSQPFAAQSASRNGNGHATIQQK